MKESKKCLIVDDEPVARDILESHLEKIDRIALAGSCHSAVEAFNIMSNTRIDLIFLDINMPEISGLSFARSLNKQVKIIFTTAYREYAVDGFDLEAVDYLLKPISFERFLKAINKYLAENDNIQSIRSELTGNKADFFYVKSDRKMVKISFNDISFVESIGDYVKIHLDNKTITTRETISALAENLPEDLFMRTHRSFIVSLNKVESYTCEYVETGSKQVPVSRSYREEVLNILANNRNT